MSNSLKKSRKRSKSEAEESTFENLLNLIDIPIVSCPYCGEELIYNPDWGAYCGKCDWWLEP